MVHIHVLLSGCNFGYDIPDRIFSDILAHSLHHIEEYHVPFDYEYLSIFEYLRDTLRKSQEPKKD